MSELEQAIKVAENLGSTAVIGWILYRLIDKWAAQFLDAQKSQATAMGSQAEAVAALVRTVQDGQTDQHEILLAVRVQSRQIEEMKEVLYKVAERG